MSFSITLQTNNSDTEHLTKDLTDVLTLDATLRDSCDLRDPVFLIAADLEDVASVNYFTVPAWGRSYYLTEPPRLVRTGILEIVGHCDVLASFAAGIRQQRAIVRRAQSPDAYNLYLNDGSLKSYQNPYILTELFPNGFTGNSFVLSVAGSPPAGPAIVIRQQPQDYTGALGDTATFTVVATGLNILYQWQALPPDAAWRDVSGATSSSFSAEITLNRLNYYYRCKLTNADGTVYTVNVRMIQS